MGDATEDDPADVEVTLERLEELIRWHGTDETALPPAHTLQNLSRDTIAALRQLARARESIARLRAAMGRAFWASDRRELHAILLEALGPPPASRPPDEPAPRDGPPSRDASGSRDAPRRPDRPSRAAKSAPSSGRGTDPSANAADATLLRLDSRSQRGPPGSVRSVSPRTPRGSHRAD